MAGVPRVMQAMFEALAAALPGGEPVLSRAVHGRPDGGPHRRDAGASRCATPISIGSYPFYRAERQRRRIVAKGTDAADAGGRHHRGHRDVRELGIEPVPGEPPA